MKKEDHIKISIIFFAVSLITLFISSSFAVAIASEGDEENSSNLEQKFQKKLDTVNIPFIQNQGQINNEKVKFYANFFSGTIFVTDDYLSYGIMDKKKKGQEIASGGYVFNEKFLNANNLSPEGKDKFSSNISYFKGTEENWKSNIPSYGTVQFREIWNNIDVELKSYGKNMEKLFYIRPQGNTNDIQMKFEGIDSVSIATDERLLIKTSKGEIAFTPPIAYQLDKNGRKQMIEVSYRIIDKYAYGFSLGDYDKDKTLVIDPLLAGTSFGTWNYEYLEVGAITSDDFGNIYAAGYTYSSFPTTVGSFNTTFDDTYEAFVSKFDSDLTTLLASTFLGSESIPDDMIFDESGNVVISGSTKSGLPVTVNAYQKVHGGGTYDDGFVAIFNDSLSELKYATYIGGSNADYIDAVDIDSSGNIFVAGKTQSPNFPVIGGSYDVTKNAGGQSDVFISKFDSQLSTLISSTYFGGNQPQSSKDIIIDDEDHVYVFGEVFNPAISSFPTTASAFQQASLGGSWDDFISKFNNNLNTLEYSTFLGGSTSEYAMGMEIDGEGNIVVSGSTNSATYPITSGAFSEVKNGSFDYFISILDPTLSTLMHSTFLGGSNVDGQFYYDKNLAIDSFGNIFVAGWASSDDFPVTPGAYNEIGPGWGDYLIVAKMNEDLSDLLAATYFGGSGGNEGTVMALDRDDNVLLGGSTVASPIFPVTAGAYNEIFPVDDYEGYLSKLDNNLSGPIVEPILSALNSIISASPSPVDVGEIVTVIITAYDTDGNPYTNGGDNVVISVTGANTVTPTVVDNGDGTYTAMYVPAISGNDQIVASINSVNVGKDNDGTSDGVFNLTVKNANISVTPIIPIIQAVVEFITQEEDDYLNLIKSEKNSLTFDALISKNKSQKTENISDRQDRGTGIKEIEIKAEHDKKIDDEFIIDKKENQPAKVILPDEVNQESCLVYSYLKIDTEISDNSIDEVNIKLRISKEWLREHSLSNIIAYQSKSKGINEKLTVKILEDSQENEIIRISPDGLSGYWIIIACGEQPQHEESFIEKPTVTTEIITEAPKNEEVNTEEIPTVNAVQANNQEEILLTVAENLSADEPPARQIVDYEKVLKIVALVGMFAQMIALATQFRTPVDLMLFLREALLRIFGILGFRRKSKIDWGTVYDAINGQPLPLTRVNLLDHISGQLKETKFTDKFGSYYFLVNPGQFQIETFKPGYLMSEEDNSARKTLYGDSYGLETLDFKDYGKVIKNIAMMKQQGRNYIRAIFNAETFKIILMMIFYLGLIANLFILVCFPSIINFIIFILYFYFVFLRHIFTSSIKWGKVIDEKGIAQIFTTIKVRNKENGKLVARTISDEKGRYFLVVNKGDYILEYMNTGENQKIHTDQISLSQRGSVKKILTVLEN